MDDGAKNKKGVARLFSDSSLMLKIKFRTRERVATSSAEHAQGYCQSNEKQRESCKGENNTTERISTKTNKQKEYIQASKQMQRPFLHSVYIIQSSSRVSSSCIDLPVSPPNNILGINFCA